MVLDEGPTVQISANLEKILSFLSFRVTKQIFSPNASRHLTRAYDWDIFWRKTWHFWIFHGNLCMFRNGRSFSSHSGLPKGPKTPWKSPFWHLLHQQEVVLGVWIFWLQNRFSYPMRSATWHALIIGRFIHQKVKCEWMNQFPSI